MKATCACALLLGLAISSPGRAADADEGEDAESDSSVSVSAGVKLYWNKTQGDGFAYSGGNLFILPFSSSREWAAIPVIGLRRGDFVLSASYMIPMTYTAIDSTRQSGDVERTEADINVGWYFLPGSVVSIGYKRATFETITAPFAGQTWKLTGPTVGVSFNAPLSDKLSLYSNLAYSRLDTSFVVDIGSADYVTLESGLAYSLEGVGSFLKGASLVAGYRYQRATTRNEVQGMYTDGATGSVPYNKRLNNSSEGLILGVFARF